MTKGYQGEETADGLNTHTHTPIHTLIHMGGGGCHIDKISINVCIVI